MDKAFGAQPDGRELAEREYRICMFEVADRLMQNRIDTAPLLAQVASGECANQLSLIYSFESEKRGAAVAKVAVERVRDGLVEEVTSSIVKKRAGFKP